jgi:hypothetical protein
VKTRHLVKQLRHLEHHLGPAAYHLTHGHDGQVLFGGAVIFLILSLLLYLARAGNSRP